MEKLVMGIDIETGGPLMYKNPLLAIGLCIYRFKNNLMILEDELEVHIEGNINDYEKDTLNFWNDNRDAWEYIKQNCISEKDAALKLITFIKQWQKYSIDNNLMFYTVTDNCWFDDTWISALLSKYGGNPLRHNYYTGYTKLSQVIDINQQIAGFRYSKIKIPEFEYTNIHEHTPVSDAKKIVEKYYNFINYTKTIKKNK